MLQKIESHNCYEIPIMEIAVCTTSPIHAVVSCTSHLRNFCNNHCMWLYIIHITCLLHKTISHHCCIIYPSWEMAKFPLHSLSNKVSCISHHGNHLLSRYVGIMHITCSSTQGLILCITHHGNSIFPSVAK